MAAMKPPRTLPLRLSRRQATAGLLALASQSLLPARAQTSDIPPNVSLYAVELVVFRGGGGAAGEDLAAASHNLNADNDSATADTARSARLAEILPAPRRKLGDVAARLNASGSHKVIAHVAWTQTASAYNAGSGLTTEQLGLSAAGLSGLVLLERGTYLHLGFNLVYAPPGGGRFALAEMRRVRFGERNYYDHPAVGIIAVVTPGAAEQR